MWVCTSVIHSNGAPTPIYDDTTWTTLRSDCGDDKERSEHESFAWFEDDPGHNIEAVISSLTN